jgi:hypothetical protein
MNTQDLETNLDRLREQYKKSVDPIDKKVLEIRGKCLKNALNYFYKRHPQSPLVPS